MARNEDPKRTAYRSELDAAEQRVRSLEEDLADARDALDAAKRGPGFGAQERRRRRRRVTFAVVGLAILGVGLGAASWLGMRGSPPRPEPPPPDGMLRWRGSNFGTARYGHEESMEPLVWDANADGIEDMVGIVSRDELGVWLAAFDGNSGAMIWQSEMLDTSGRGYSTLMMSHDGHVVTTTTLGEALALELTSGKTVARHKLVGEVARLCEKEDGVVVALKGGGGMTHRARTGFTVGDFGCPPTPWRSEKPELTAPQFRAWRVVQRDGKLYALGENDRSRPEVLAYEAGRREILWRRLLTTEDARAPNLVDAFAVNDDCVYAEYELGAPAGNGDNRLLCLDPKDGEKRWEVPVRLAKPFYPPPTIKVLAGKTRLFWVRSERVDILDADSGNHLGFVGWH